MTLTKAQKEAVAEIIRNAAASANHHLVHSDSDEKRDFYRRLVGEAEALLPIFKGREPIEVEEEEEDDEEEHSA